ncbi:MAG: helix-turn-helix domain-containing protein [Robiginitomaculum sp.]|nr:helix-turn-helix domain-containing protein [Robiginitomaculum sp.]
MRQTTLSSKLVMPPPALVGCVFAYILRDTRALSLAASERLNRFPASPLCAITWFFDGESHIIIDKNNSIPMPSLAFSGPQRNPILSFNPGAVYALTMGFYPEAWTALTGRNADIYIDQTLPLKDVVNSELLNIFKAVLGSGAFPPKLDVMEKKLRKIWEQTRPRGLKFSFMIRDWVHVLAVRAATSGAGKSIRQTQRRVKNWTGQNQRDLAAYARLESLFLNWLQSRNDSKMTLAELAIDTGFSDQSHMGREVTRFIGMSPAKLNRLIDTDESFWFYRLIGEQY